MPSLQWYMMLKEEINISTSCPHHTSSILCAYGVNSHAIRLYGLDRTHSPHNMMTSSNGNIFRVTGPLWRESTGDRWIPLTKASDEELWRFLWHAPEQMVGRTIEAIALIMTSLQWNAVLLSEMYWAYRMVLHIDMMASACYPRWIMGCVDGVCLRGLCWALDLTTGHLHNSSNTDSWVMGHWLTALNVVLK